MTALAFASALLVGVVPAGIQSATASTGGTVTGTPVDFTLHPVSANGSASGLLGGAIDLPVLIGDIGRYTLAGPATPGSDSTGNGLTDVAYPAGTIEGILTDPEDGDIDDEPGQGIEIGDSTDRVVRTPAGLHSTTDLKDVVINIAKVVEEVGSVLGREEVVRVDRVVTEAVAGVDGSSAVGTRIEGLELLGETIPLVDGRLPEAASRSQYVMSNDVVALLRSLGVDPEDIDEYAGYIQSSRMDATLTMTASMPVEGGLAIQAHLDLRIQASAGFLGSADVRAVQVVLEGVFARSAVTAPTAIAVSGLTLAADEAESGSLVTLSGVGFIPGATSVTIGGTPAEVSDVAADGTSLSFLVPSNLPTGSYAVSAGTVGGNADAGQLRVMGDDYVPLSVTGVTPATTNDGATVAVSGGGFVAGETGVIVTDAQGTRHQVPASDISVAESGLTLTLRLPEGLALGTATIAVTVAGDTESTTVEIVALQLPGVPSTGTAGVTGISTTTVTIPITVDNSGTMTWTAPTVINPAGSAGTTTTLQVGLPDLDANGQGTRSGVDGGITGTVVRDLESLTATASASGWAMQLPAPWNAFFNRGNVVTADQITVSSTAAVGGASSNQVVLSNLQVLGNPVALVNGQVQSAQEFTVALGSDDLKNRQAMNNVFFSAPGEAYNRLKSATSAQLWIRIEPVAASAAGGSASAGAFRIVADMRYNYEGENGGFISTRARHGTGDSRSGVRVPLLTTVVAQTSVAAPSAIAPEVVSASPSLVDAGDTVTLTGRGFTSSSVVMYAGQELPASNIAANGTSLTFVVPAEATGRTAVSVKTAAGTSATSRLVTVMAAPVVTDHPESVQITGARTVRLAAAAAGQPAPTVQWEREIEGVWTPIDGATSTQLEIAATRDDDGARFRAVFTNAKGDATTTVATLSVEFAPEIVSVSSLSGYTAGDVVELEAEAVGRPLPTYAWQINRGSGWVALATGASAEYTVTPADHDALVRVVATNSHGSDTSEGQQLAVSFESQVTTQPQAATVEEGSTATFTAAATGNPVPVIQWQFRHSIGATWSDIDTETNPSAATGTLSLAADMALNGLLFRAEFWNGVGQPAYTTPVALTVTAKPVDPGTPGEFSALSGPLSVGVDALIAKGNAVGALSGLINAELSKGVEIGENGVFALAESGTPTTRGEIVREYPAGTATGSESGDLSSGTTYGDVLVRNVWDTEGIRSTVTVDSFRFDDLAIDEKGRVGTLLGISEIVEATGITATSVAPGDADAATTASASIESIAVLGEELDAADGFVDGKLTHAVVKEHDIVITDFESVLAQLGVDPSAFLSEPLIGTATANVVVTVSQPRATDADTAYATGLHVTVKAGFELEAETQGVDRSILESVVIATEGLVQTVEIDVAETAAARNGASLPEPTDPVDPTDPTDPTDPVIPDLPLRPIEAYAPTSTPDRVIQTLTGDAATTRTVTWRTDDTVTASSIEYRTVGGTATSVAATTRAPLERTGLQGADTLTYRATSHVANLTGLAPDTAYEYRVGGAAGWSQWFSFRTASTTADPFTFLYMGDAQNDLRAQWEEGMQMALETVPEAELAVHGGDQINHADNDVQWGEWFAATPEFMAGTPQVVTPGNHEFLDGALYNAWEEHYTYPMNGPQVDPTADSCTRAYQAKIVDSLAGSVYYSDYQGVRFISLSGTIGLRDFLPTSEQLAAAGCTTSVDVIATWMNLQADFLDKALDENPGQWSVLTMHQPIFSTSVGRDNSHLRDALLPIIEEHNVDLILQGHDHTYGRGHLEANEVTGQTGLQTGPVYVVSVLGPKSYDLDKAELNDWTENGANRVVAYEKVRTFQEITVDGGRLTYTAHQYNSGDIVDSFTICKNGDGDKLVAENGVSLPENCDAPSEPGEPVVDRVSGANRYDTATNISKTSYPDGSDAVYVTTGANYPDALAAGPAAARDDAPLLLVTPTSIPDSVKAEIARLDPSRIVVVGGTNTVSSGVYTQLAAMTDSIERIAGLDRFETSRLLAEKVFGTADHVYIATGLNFPDALAAGPAAGSKDAPIILVNGGAASLDSKTAVLLEGLGASGATVVGGTASVSGGVLSSINGIVPATRVSGSTRFETARLVNADAFETADTVLLATGLNFPDALAGSAWGAAIKAPLYTVHGDCVPADVVSDIQKLGATTITLLGGQSSLGGGVAVLKPCV